MVTAIMIGPQGEMFTPRYEKLIFDNLEQCQAKFDQAGFYGVMYSSVQSKYPNNVLQTIGCGAWDMNELLQSNSNNKTVDTPKKFY